MLYDRNPYGSPYDREATIVETLKAYVDTETSNYGAITIDYALSIGIDTNTDIYANGVNHIAFETQIDTDTDIYANILRVVGLMAYIDTDTDVYADLKRYLTRLYVYTGDLAVGETITIDGLDFTVLKDGSNVMDKYSSAIFPKLETGKNTILYTDSEGARTVLITVTKSDRRL